MFTLLAPIVLSLVFSTILGKKDFRTPALLLCDSGGSTFGAFVRESGSFEVIDCRSSDEARTAVLQGRGAVALILKGGVGPEGSPPKMELLVDETSPNQVNFALVVLREMARTYRSQTLPMEFTVEKVREMKGGPRLSMLPVWLLFSLMGSLMIVTSSLIEEKEKKTLAALLVTPAGMGEIVWGKVAVGSCLSLASVLLILALNQGFSGNTAALLLFALLGSLLFSFTGVLVGILSPSQTSAGALNSLIFMALFMPVVLADVSKVMAALCVVLPTHYLYEGIGRSLLAGFGPVALKGHLLFLLALDGALILTCQAALRRRER